MSGTGGLAFNVAGASGLASITYDGTDFWIGDYSGSNHAFQYTPTGTLLKTITLTDCTSFCDGLTFFKQGGAGFLISNRVDGCCNGTPVQYDVYDTNGNLVTADLITNPLASTGIAWDGTNFWTSNILNGSVSEWSMSGAFIKTENVTGGSPRSAYRRHVVQLRPDGGHSGAGYVGHVRNWHCWFGRIPSSQVPRLSPRSMKDREAGSVGLRFFRPTRKTGVLPVEKQVSPPQWWKPARDQQKWPAVG